MAYNMTVPTRLTTFRGGRFTNRTASALRWVEKHANVGDLQIAQGGWNAGGVAQSGGTHDKDGVDLRIKHLSATAKQRLLRTMKDAGFAAWIRPAVSGLWGEHLHAVPVPPGKQPATIARYLSPAAAAQVLSYDAGRDGLKGNRVDKSYRPSPRVRWSHLQNKPVPR